MQVSDLQIKDEHKTISSDTTLDKAAKKILDLERGVLVVLENENPLGILTDSHILKALSKSLDCRSEICRDHLDADFISVKLDDDIKNLSMRVKLNKRKTSAVIVVNDSNAFVGYFSPNDYREALSSL